MYIIKVATIYPDLFFNLSVQCLKIWSLCIGGVNLADIFPSFRFVFRLLSTFFFFFLVHLLYSLFSCKRNKMRVSLWSPRFPFYFAFDNKPICYLLHHSSKLISYYLYYCRLVYFFCRGRMKWLSFMNSRFPSLKIDKANDEDYRL